MFKLFKLVKNCSNALNGTTLLYFSSCITLNFAPLVQSRRRWGSDHQVNTIYLSGSQEFGKYCPVHDFGWKLDKVNCAKLSFKNLINNLI